MNLVMLFGIFFELFGEESTITNSPPPHVEYFNYWSGAALTEIDLAGGKWDVVENEMFINLWDPEERETYEVRVSRFGSTEGQAEFFIQDFQYSRTELEHEIDEENID